LIETQRPGKGAGSRTRFEPLFQSGIKQIAELQQQIKVVDTTFWMKGYIIKCMKKGSVQE